LRKTIEENPLASMLVAGLVLVLGLLTVGLIGNSQQNNLDTSGSATDEEVGVAAEDGFDYSAGISENGFWEGITATDHVEPFDITTFEIPASVHEVTEQAMEESLQSFLSYVGAPVTEIRDRAVASGDQVNIDYVGSVDGVEFDGGSTQDAGTTVTAGGTDYIDDFLDQIIGHMPGETFDVVVTFPDEYPNSPDLEGKEAVFVTTINYIEEPAELTDEFVEENLSATYGWHTVAEMEAAQREELQQAAIESYVDNHLRNEIPVSNIPESLIAYQEQTLLQYFQDYAANSGMSLTELLQSEVGVDDTDQLLEMYRSEIEANAGMTLVIQAIAEQNDITVTQDDLDEFMPDYADYVDEYGMPFINQYVLEKKVLDWVITNARLA